MRLDWCDVTPADEDDYLKVVDVVADVDVEESVGESLAIASSMATVWQQHFHFATDQNHLIVYSFVFEETDSNFLNIFADVDVCVEENLGSSLAKTYKQFLWQGLRCCRKLSPICQQNSDAS